MIEKTAVFARYLLQPTESLDNGLAVEALIFPAYPIGKHHVQVVHHFDKLGLAKLVVVIAPTSDLALNLYPHLLEFPVKMGMFSISQMSNDELVQSLPWRENICKANAVSTPSSSHAVSSPISC